MNFCCLLVFSLLNFTFISVSYATPVAEDSLACSPSIFREDSVAFVSTPAVSTTCQSVTTTLREAFITPISAQLEYSVKNGYGYLIEWRQTESPNWNSFNRGVVQFDGYTGYTVNNLTPSAAYEWRVTTVCPEGGSIVSPTRSFTAVCATPVSLFIAQVSGTSARLAWSGDSQQTYQVRWRVAAQDYLWTEGEITTGWSYSLTNLTANATYEWQVQMVCDGTGTPYSYMETFATGCGSPFNNRPSANSRTSVLITWSRLGSATATVVQWRPVSSTDWPNSLTTTFSGASLTGLSPNSVYEWRLQSVCSQTATSIFTAPQSVTTVGCLPPIGLREYFFNATSVQLSANWQTGDRLLVNWRQQGSTTWNSSGTLTSASYYPQNLSPSTGYEWQIQTICSDGSVSYFSPVRSFTTLALCSGFVTLKEGNWNDPSVWSCGWVPTQGEQAILRHRITLPHSIGLSGSIRKISFEQNGTLIMSNGSRIRMAP